MHTPWNRELADGLRLTAAIWHRDSVRHAHCRNREADRGRSDQGGGDASAATPPLPAQPVCRYNGFPL